MKLYEHEGKSLFKILKIAVPEGKIARNAQDAKRVAQEIGYPVVIKGQVLRGGRGKAGGVAFATDLDMLVDVVENILGSKIKGETVERVLIEQKLTVAQELYAGITFNAESEMPLLMLSARGGIDIETLAVNQPEAIIKQELNPLKTSRMHHMLAVAKKAGITGRPLVQTADILCKLAVCYFKYEAITAEINPLVIQSNGQVCAADAKIEIDDSALFRQPEILAFDRTQDPGDPLEVEARDAGISYVRLKENGNIGLIAGGAGLGMASMDAIYHHGGIPANFLDLGHATPEKTTAAMKIVLKTPGVAGIFVNAYGGMNNCGEIGEGIIKGLDEARPTQAIVVKMRGHSQKRGWQLLADRGIPVIKYGTTSEGIRLLIKEMEKREGVHHGDSDRSK
jgi:succinyl-CoA synthetase beta subunit